MDCDCCEPPQGLLFGSDALYCTVHRTEPAVAPATGLLHDWSRHHCQDGPSVRVPVGPPHGPRILRIRSDGTHVYTLGYGCGKHVEVFNTPGADTFTWPVGVRKITVTITGGGGNGGSGSAASGGGGGGSWVQHVLTRTADENTTRTDDLYVGDGTEDSWFFDNTTALAKAGSSAAGTTGGAGGLASASIGDITKDGGDGADANGADGGGGGGAAGGAPNGVAAEGNDGHLSNGGVSIYDSGAGGDGGFSGNPGSNGDTPGGGGGGSGDGDSTFGTGAAGQVIVTYHVKQPLQKWDSSGNLVWEVETRISDTLGYKPRCLEVRDGLVVATVEGTDDGSGGSPWLIAVNAGTGAIDWVYQRDTADLSGYEEIHDIAMADSGIYSIGTTWLQRWDTSGNLLNRIAPGGMGDEFSGPSPCYGRTIAVDADCYIYLGTLEFSSAITNHVVKYAPIHTAVTTAGICSFPGDDDTPSRSAVAPAILGMAEVGYLDCAEDEDIPGLRGPVPPGDSLKLMLRLSPSEEVLYLCISVAQAAGDDPYDPYDPYEAGETPLCNLYQLDPADLAINWGRRTPGTVQEGSGALPVDVFDLSARDDGVIAAVAVDTLPPFPVPNHLAVSYDDAGLLEYQSGLESPPSAGYYDVLGSVQAGHIWSVAAGSSGVWYGAGTPASCDTLVDPDLDEGDTCCDEELTEVISACGSGEANLPIPATVADVVPAIDCWEVPEDLEGDCLTCLESLAGEAITWRLVSTSTGPLAGIFEHVWTAALRVQCEGESGDCGEDHWLQLFAEHTAGGGPNGSWSVYADFSCGEDIYEDRILWPCLRVKFPIPHCGSTRHDHPWFEVCCLLCEDEDPPSDGLCAWQWDAGEADWVLLKSFAGDGYTCFEESKPSSPGSEDGEISCTCPCSDGCAEADEDYVWSKSCPCEVFPKQFIGTLPGLGCFAGDTIEVTYNWQGDCVWEGVFTPDPSCPSETATHTLVETDDGFDGTMTWTCASGNKTAHHPLDCETLIIGPGDTAYFWTAEELTCECCDDGGGFGDPGVETDCCEDSIPETLTATLGPTSGSCSCYDGQSVSLVYNSGSGMWEGTLGSSGDACDNGDLTLKFYCDGIDASGFRLDVLCSNGSSNDVGNTPDGTETCDPLSVTFLGTTAGLCCNGIGPQNLDVTVSA